MKRLIFGAIIISLTLLISCGKEEDEKNQQIGTSASFNNAMMGQYMPEVSDKGVLKAWFVGRLVSRARSNAGAGLGGGCGRFAFDSVGDAKTDAVSVEVDKARAQLQSLEGMLKPEQINQLGVALDERDELRQRLLTTEQIYSVIGDYIGSANESDVRKAIDDLIKNSE